MAAERMPEIAKSAASRRAAYIRAALTRAQYEELPDNEGFYAEIPEFQGVWANAPTLDACRQELEEVLAGWLELRLGWQRPVPVVDGMDLTRDAAI